VLDRPNAREILTGYNFQCDAGNDTQVALLSVMDGSAVGSRDRKPGKGPAPQVSGLVGPGGVNKATQKKGLGAGAIAGRCRVARTGLQAAWSPPTTNRLRSAFRAGLMHTLT
jgi:hypothetical protein